MPHMHAWVNLCAIPYNFRASQSIFVMIIHFRDPKQKYETVAAIQNALEVDLNKKILKETSIRTRLTALLEALIQV